MITFSLPILFLLKILPDFNEVFGTKLRGILKLWPKGIFYKFLQFFKFFIVATEKIALKSTLKLNSLIYGKEKKYLLHGDMLVISSSDFFLYFKSSCCEKWCCMKDQSRRFQSVNVMTIIRSSLSWLNSFLFENFFLCILIKMTISMLLVS